MRFLVPILFFLTSCGLFSPRPSLRDKETSELRSAVLILGEGRGRLTAEGKQNVFGFDALLRDSDDWIFAASVPLHGEEVMILSDLKKENLAEVELESGFELRLVEALSAQKKYRVSPAEFKLRLRRLIRFLLARQLGLEGDCDSELCHNEGRSFAVSTEKDIFSVEETGQKEFFLIAQGKNLTDSFFTQTIISLRDHTREEIFSLELFWK